jgi:hypothetical protein
MKGLARRLVLCAHFVICCGIIAPYDKETQSPLLGLTVDEGLDESGAVYDSLDSIVTGIDTFVEDALRKWDLPGISIAIIRQNKTMAKVR